MSDFLDFLPPNSLAISVSTPSSELVDGVVPTSDDPLYDRVVTYLTQFKLDDPGAFLSDPLTRVKEMLKEAVDVSALSEFVDALFSKITFLPAFVLNGIKQALGFITGGEVITPVQAQAVVRSPSMVEDAKKIEKLEAEEASSLSSSLTKAAVDVTTWWINEKSDDAFSFFSQQVVNLFGGSDARIK